MQASVDNLQQTLVYDGIAGALTPNLSLDRFIYSPNVKTIPILIIFSTRCSIHINVKSKTRSVYINNKQVYINVAPWNVKL